LQCLAFWFEATKLMHLSVIIPLLYASNSHEKSKIAPNACI
jgi:hypothetical protein